MCIISSRAGKKKLVHDEKEMMSKYFGSRLIRLNIACSICVSACAISYGAIRTKNRAKRSCSFRVSRLAISANCSGEGFAGAFEGVVDNRGMVCFSVFESNRGRFVSRTDVKCRNEKCERNERTDHISAYALESFYKLLTWCE